MTQAEWRKRVRAECYTGAPVEVLEHTLLLADLLWPIAQSVAPAPAAGTTEDTARLDWLRSHCCVLWIRDGDGVEVAIGLDYDDTVTIRDVIDAMRPLPANAAAKDMQLAIEGKYGLA